MTHSTFKKTLLHTSIITILAASLANVAHANETIDPEQNSSINLIQTNDSGSDDRHIADVHSKGDGGIILQGLNTTSSDQSLVQIILSQYVNRGQKTDNYANILDINVNNQNVDSQNTFYLTQIGGSWLIMNVDGENNTVSISELAGKGFDLEDRDDLKDSPSDDITQLSINGNDNYLTLTPTMIGNIAKRLNVDLSQNDGTTHANIINIAYSDFADVVVELVDANYSIIDIEQFKSEELNEEDNESLDNMVYLNIIEADGTITRIVQDGVNNQSNLSISGTNNEVTTSQKNDNLNSDNNFNARVSGDSNKIIINQHFDNIKNSKNEINSIKIDLIDSNNSSIELTQIGTEKSNKNTIDLTVSGSEHDINVSQSINNQLTASINGSSNTLTMQENSNTNVTATVDGRLNNITIDGLTWLELITEIRGEENNLSLLGVEQADLHGEISVNGKSNNYSIELSQHIGVYDKINGNNNSMIYEISESPMTWIHTDNQINGNNNNILLDFNNESFNYMDIYQRVSISGTGNDFKLSNGQNNKTSPFLFSEYNVEVEGDQNVIDLQENNFDDGFNYSHIVIDGNRNNLSLKPVLSTNYFSLIGDDNIVNLHGTALNDSSVELHLNGYLNTLDINVDGLYGDNIDLDIVGDNNTMNFNLSAGNISYELTGSNFIGTVNTYNNISYYQQIEKLGTGTIQMITDSGIVNVSSNCEQSCNPAT